MLCKTVTVYTKSVFLQHANENYILSIIKNVKSSNAISEVTGDVKYKKNEQNELRVLTKSSAKCEGASFLESLSIENILQNKKLLPRKVAILYLFPVNTSIVDFQTL